MVVALYFQSGSIGHPEVYFRCLLVADFLTLQLIVRLRQQLYFTADS